MENEEKNYSIEIEGVDYPVDDRIGKLIYDISMEKDEFVEFSNQIIEAKKKFGNDADLGKFVRNLINEKEKEWQQM
jgi:methyl coenzyme M reductase subunit D